MVVSCEACEDSGEKSRPRRFHEGYLMGHLKDCRHQSEELKYLAAASQEDSKKEKALKETILESMHCQRVVKQKTAKMLKQIIPADEDSSLSSQRR
jgi:hypothetical protein